MERKPDIRFFDVTVRVEDLEEDVFPILSALRAEWRREDLRSEAFTKGLLNNMVCFYHRDDPKRSDGIVVRVYGKTFSDLNPREKEFMNIQIAHAAGCFPAIYASFNNGLVYKYAPGRYTNYHDVTKPENIRNISRLLYRLHHVDVDQVALVDRRGNPVTYDKTPTLLDQMKDSIAAIPDAPKSAKKQKQFKELRASLSDEVLMEEYNFMKAILEEVNPPVSFTHADFHPRNIIINDETGDITFIDYEMACFGYMYSDLSAFFMCKKFFDIMGFTTEDEPEMTTEIKELYLDGYLDAQREAEGSTGNRAIEAELLEICHDITGLSDTVKWFAMGLAMVDIDIAEDQDFMDMMPTIKEHYYLGKSKVVALKDRYLQLKEQC